MTSETNNYEPPGTDQQVALRAELDLLLNQWAAAISQTAIDKLRAEDPVNFDAVSDEVRELIASTTYAGAIEALQAFVKAPGVLVPSALINYLREGQSR